MVRSRRFHCWGLGLIPGWGTKIPQAMWHGQRKKETQNLSHLSERKIGS